MILPVLVTEHYISALLVDDASGSSDGNSTLGDIKIKGNVFFQIPYQENPLKPHVDIKDIISKVKEKFGSEAESVDPIIIQDQMENLINNIPLPVIFLDHFNFKDYNKWDDSDINAYHNHLGYSQPIPKTLKNPIDTEIVRNYTKRNVGSLLGMHHVLLATPGTCGIDHKTYIKKIVEDYAGSVNIAGVWDFTLDDQIGLLPFVITLKSKDIDIAKYFKDNPLKPDAKLVVAPGVEEVEYAKGGKSKDANFKKEKLEKDTITTISVKPEEKVHIKWKTTKTKYDGELYGSELGIIIDNKERRPDA